MTGARWFDSEWAWIVFADDESATEAAMGVRAAISAFYLHFGIVPGRGAILHPRYAGLYGKLGEAGAEWLIPWSFDGLATSASAPPTPDLAKHLTTRLIGQGLADPQPGPPVVLRNTIDEKVNPNPPSHVMLDVHHVEMRSAFRHEIAHALFLAYVIPNTRKGQYASDAPDWLDEAAAIIAETPDVAASRRDQFIGAVRAGRVPRLSDILTGMHPVLAAPAVQHALAAARKASPSAPVLLRFQVSDTGLDRETIADFYAQARAVTDYLILRTGNSRVLAEIAASFRQNGDPLSWVATIPTRGTLPATIPDLDEDFRAWSKSLSRGVPP